MPSPLALQKIAESAHVPAVSYAYVEPKEVGKHELVSTSIAVGKKNAQSDADMNDVDGNTRFPAASLSKIVFTYLVLQLAKAGKIDLDKPLYETLECERLKINGKYPDEATQNQAEKLTARHVLSHTTGLPNVSGDAASILSFIHSEPGNKYSYSGEAFIYLQQVIEAKMSKESGMKVDLEMLAKQYVFDPLKMTHSTFKPQPKDDPDIVAVHTHLGKSSSVDETLQDHLRVNAAGSLLTTADDFSKFMTAWLENMDNPDDPLIQKAFEPMVAEAKQFETCGLGWHLYRDKDKLFAYQYGENRGMKSFVVLNLTDKKGAVIFTNSEHGMSIGNQLLSSPSFAPIGDMTAIFKHQLYSQSDEPGWKEMLEGEMAEDQNDFDKAREHFQNSCDAAPSDKSKHQRLNWFDEVHSSDPKKQSFTAPLESFVGTYKNPWGDTRELSIRDGCLIHKERDHEIKLVRVSETEFLPEKDQSFKISIAEGKMSIHSIDGWGKSLGKQSIPQSQLQDIAADREVIADASVPPLSRPILLGAVADTVLSISEEAVKAPPTDTVKSTPKLPEDQYKTKFTVDSSPIIKTYQDQFKERHEKQDAKDVVAFKDMIAANSFFTEMLNRKTPFLATEAGKDYHLYSCGDGKLHTGSMKEVRTSLQESLSALKDNSPDNQARRKQIEEGIAFIEHTVLSINPAAANKTESPGVQDATNGAKSPDPEATSQDLHS